MPYKCSTLGADIQTDNLEVSKITGYHHYRRTNIHVEKLEFNHQKWSSYLPNGFGIIFPNLLEMEVQATPLRALRRNNFVGMSKLLVLNLDEARLANIANNTFVDLVNLEELSITKSFLTVLPVNIFLPLTRLRAFDGKHNKITQLSRDLFRGNPAIAYINLIGNAFHDIKVDFTTLQSIREIYLLKCGCINTYYVKMNPRNTLKDLNNLIKRKCTSSEK